MRVNFISGNTIISRVYDEFNLTSDDWVNRVPQWIYQALRLLNNNKVFVNIYIKGKFQEYKIELPEYDGIIKLLSINNNIIINPDHIHFDRYNYNILNDPNNTAILDSLPIISDDNTFNINNSLSRDEAVIPNNINTDTFWKHHKQPYFIERNIVYNKYNFGYYKLWYKTIPTEFNDKLQTYIPSIPDIEEVIDNIKWYVFKNMLSRGYKHPIYNLGNRDIEYDPNKKHQITIKGARLALSEMDINDRNELANNSMSFFNLQSYKTGQVENLFELFKYDAI